MLLVPYLYGFLIAFPMLCTARKESSFSQGVFTSVNGKPITAFEIAQKAYERLPKSNEDISQEDLSEFMKAQWHQSIVDTTDLALLREEARRLFLIRKAKNVDTLSEQELHKALVDYLRYCVQMEISPKKVRRAFHDYQNNCENNQELQYRVISLTSPLSEEEKIMVETTLKTNSTLDELIKCPGMDQKLKVSNPYVSSAKNLLPEYKNALKATEPGKLSQLLMNHEQHIILSLDKKLPYEKKSFQEMEGTLEMAIIHQELEEKLNTLLLELRAVNAPQ